MARRAWMLARVGTGLWLTCLAAPAAQADPAYDRCVAAGSTNVDYAACGDASIKRADAALNQVWRRVYAQTQGRSKADLLAEQRAWIAFKEASCRFYANGDFGREGQVLSFPACRAEVIRQRTAQLQVIGKGLQRP